MPAFYELGMETKWLMAKLILICAKADQAEQVRDYICQQQAVVQLPSYVTNLCVIINNAALVAII